MTRRKCARTAPAWGRHSGGGTLLGLKQVHGPEVVTVRAAWAEGDGPRADAMVTDVPGLALGVITADCAPVLFCATDGSVIGAAHAGWKGAVSGVLEASVEAMRHSGPAASPPPSGRASSRRA